MKLHYVGEVIVSDCGICKVIDVDDNNICTAETILPKDSFVEAFEKYIYNPTVITCEPLSNEETEKLIKDIQNQPLRCMEIPQGETNADLFKRTFGIYATEVWSMRESQFLEWLNSEVRNDT